jgi:catechol 2,3-dioxygenase-like lactoylglutathione lyase family enzyme
MPTSRAKRDDAKTREINRLLDSIGGSLRAEGMTLKALRERGRAIRAALALEKPGDASKTPPAARITQIHHVTIYVPRAKQAAAEQFYGGILNLPRIARPAAFGGERDGAWYELGGVQLHLSVSDRQQDDNEGSGRHVCYMVADLAEAEAALRAAGVEIVPDPVPFDEWARVFVRDPGGNYIEIASKKRGV